MSKGNCLGVDRQEWGEGKERILRGESNESTLHIYIWWNPPNTVKEGKEWTCSMYTLHMYGIITMKPFHIISVL
jgi:hypothetical protein